MASTTDPFEQVARDLQRLRDIQRTSSTNTTNTTTDHKEEVRLLRIELQHKEASEIHLQQVTQFLKKQEGNLKSKVQQLEEQSNISNQQYIELQLEQKQQQTTIGSSAEMLALVRSKWEEVKQHQSTVTEERLKLEQEVEHFNQRQHQFVQQQQLQLRNTHLNLYNNNALQQRQQLPSPPPPQPPPPQQQHDNTATTKTLYKTDEVRRLKVELAQLRKDHATTKDNTMRLNEENNKYKSKLERATQRILSLKESNDVLQEERHRLMAALAPSVQQQRRPAGTSAINSRVKSKSNTSKTNTPPPPATTLLQKMKKFGTLYPHDRKHNIVQEVEFAMGEGFGVVEEVGDGRTEVEEEQEESYSFISEEAGETKFRSGRMEEKAMARSKKTNGEHRNIAELQQEYQHKFNAAEKHFESSAALALMASENAMREEYRLELSLYQERERSAREEMLKLKETVQLLLAKKKKKRKKNRKYKQEESEEEESEEDTF